MRDFWRLKNIVFLLEAALCTTVAFADKPAYDSPRLYYKEPLLTKEYTKVTGVDLIETLKKANGGRDDDPVFSNDLIKRIGGITTPIARYAINFTGEIDSDFVFTVIKKILDDCICQRADVGNIGGIGGGADEAYNELVKERDDILGLFLYATIITEGSDKTKRLLPLIDTLGGGLESLDKKKRYAEITDGEYDDAKRKLWGDFRREKDKFMD